jgi:acetyl-CoA carboxylase carboxyltransferase component
MDAKREPEPELTYREKIAALVDEGGWTRSEAIAMLADMGEDE